MNKSNPGLTLAILFLVAGSISLGLLMFGPKHPEEQPYPESEARKNKRMVEESVTHQLAAPMQKTLDRLNPNNVSNAIVFGGGVNNAEWLVVHRHKSYSGGENGFDPCYTDIESDFKPHIEKKGAKWFVTFGTDDITTEFQP